MTSNATILDQTTTDAREIDDTQLDAVCGGVGEEVRFADLAGEPDGAAPSGITLAAEVRRAGRNERRRPLHEPAAAPE